jgi:hypothetical protein
VLEGLLQGELQGELEEELEEEEARQPADGAAGEGSRRTTGNIGDNFENGGSSGALPSEVTAALRTTLKCLRVQAGCIEATDAAGEEVLTELTAGNLQIGVAFSTSPFRILSSGEVTSALLPVELK